MLSKLATNVTFKVFNRQGLKLQSSLTLNLSENRTYTSFLSKPTKQQWLLLRRLYSQSNNVSKGKVHHNT